MRFILLADSHVGGKNGWGYCQQPNYPEQTESLLRALKTVIREQQILFLIHCGDLTDHGRPEVIRHAADLFGQLGVPVYLVPGNHDLMQPDCEAVWLKNAVEFFPEGTLDTTFLYEGLRFDLLCNYWTGTERCWYGKLDPALGEEQFARLRSGSQDVPRVIVMHSQICPAQTPEGKILEPPDGRMGEIGMSLIREFHPQLIAGGHNHINLHKVIGETHIATVSAFCETPFELKIFEWSRNILSMKTFSLAPYLNFSGDFKEEKRFICGGSSDREF